jgi:hypothetical protein
MIVLIRCDYTQTAHKGRFLAPCAQAMFPGRLRDEARSAEKRRRGRWGRRQPRTPRLDSRVETAGLVHLLLVRPDALGALEDVACEKAIHIFFGFPLCLCRGYLGKTIILV